MPELAEAAICMRIGGFESHFCHWSVLRARNKTLRSSQTSLAAGSRRVTSVQVFLQVGRPVLHQHHRRGAFQFECHIDEEAPIECNIMGSCRTLQKRWRAV